MSESPPPRSGSLPRRLLQVVAVLLVLAALGYALTLSLGASALSRAVDRWDAAGLSLERFLEASEPSAANAAALELEGLALAVGIEWAPKSVDRPRPEEQPRRPAGATEGPIPVREAYDATRDWLHEVLADEDAALREPPAVLTAWLAEHASDWKALRARLASGEAPRWESDLSKGFDAPIPNLLGYMRVGSLLHADALAAAREGRRAAADEALAASWTLTESLAGSETLIGHLIRIALTQQQAGVLRRIPWLEAEPWSGRLLARSLRRELGTGLRGEGAAVLQAVRSGGSPAELVTGAGASVPERFLAGALVRHGAAAWLDLLLVAAESIEEEPHCPNLHPVTSAQERAAESWNPTVDSLTVSLDRFLARTALAEYQDELTAKVLLARAAGGTPDESWPASRCEQLAYELDAAAEGAWRVGTASTLPEEMRVVQDSSANHPPRALAHLEPAPGPS